MDRTIIYPGAIPLDTDQLAQGRYTKEALGRVLDVVMGRNTQSAVGLPVTLSGSALTLTVGVGVVNCWNQVDVTAIGGQGGGLPADTLGVTNQYINDTVQTVTIPAAGATYTIYAQCAESDISNTLLPFYNASNPSQTQAGPNNTGALLPTQRTAAMTFVVATSPPAAPTNGVSVALYTLVVPSGATNLSSSTLTALNPPFYWTIPQIEAAVTPLLPLPSELSAEVSRAENAESSLGSRITSETSRAEGAETSLSNAIGAETNRAESAESLINTKLVSLGAPQVYTSSASVIVPTWATRALIRVIGPGGAGCGCYASSTTQISGGGGGAGGDACGMFGSAQNLAPGTVLALTVGASGGTSSVGWALTATSNYQIIAYSGNGSYWNENGFTSAGAAGGVSGGGNLWNFTGAPGSDGQYSKTANGFFAGNGANGPFGGGGRAGEAGGAGGTSFGAGGGGAYDPNSTATAYNGGSGYQGAVIITFFP